MSNELGAIEERIKADKLMHDECRLTVLDEIKQLWEAINKLRDRPPVWCTVLIALLSGALGSTITSLVGHVLN